MKTMHFDTLSHIRSTPSMAMNSGICSFWTAFCRADAIILTRLSDEPIEKANIGSWTPFEIQHRWDFCVRLKHRLYWIFDGVTMTFNILTLFLGNAVNIPEISFRQRNNQFWLSFQWHCSNCFKSDSFRRQRNDFSVFPLPQLKWRPFAIVGKTLCLFRVFQLPQKIMSNTTNIYPQCECKTEHKIRKRHIERSWVGTFQLWHREMIATQQQP